MSSAAPEFIHINQPSPPSTSSTPFDPAAFTLTAPSKTDIHASPVPAPRYIFTAPAVLGAPARPLAAFTRARVSFAYTPALQYDHAGLALLLGASSSDADGRPGQVGRHSAWVKAGLEAKDGAVWLSVVTKTAGGWCDWSLGALPDAEGAGAGLGREVAVTIELERAKNALLVHHVRQRGGADGAEGEEEGDEHKTLIRKVPWVFLDAEDRVVAEGDESAAWVGAFAARPDPEGRAGEGGRLEVRFWNLEIAGR
ncbi:hypothetical protein JX266_003707 [Neoarthrinium moseri]|nr:hypothetical protein JX266_003707 [Neoarthrinium moseri]